MTKSNEGGAGSKVCAGCGKVFVPKQPHFNRCDDCFRQGGSRLGETRVPPASLPSGYLSKGYFGGRADYVLLPELLTSEAEQVARALVTAGVSMGQLRRYFTMARSLKDRLENHELYAQVANELRRMKSNVAAVVGRVQEGYQRERLANTLRVFIDRNVDAAVRDEQSFLRGFLTHFECVLGYFYWHNSQRGGRRRGS